MSGLKQSSMIKFQYYPADIKKCKPIGFVSLERFLKAVKTPNPKTMEVFEQIKRAEEVRDFETKAELKKKLFKFTPCAIVNEWRSYKNIVSFTGLLVLDFDHLEEKEAITLKRVLFDSCDFVIASWLSPSRHGIKVLVQIPVCESVEEFQSYFKAIENQLGTLKGFDKTAKNCVLDLFMSYDADLLYRDNATTWTEKYIEPPKPINEVSHFNYDNKQSFTENNKKDVIVKIVLNNVRKITNEGHYILRKVSYCLGGYSKAGYIDFEDAKDIIFYIIDNHGYLNQKAETYKKTAETMLKEGYKQALYLDDEYLIYK